MNVVKFLLILSTLLFAAHAQDSEDTDQIANYSQEQLEREVLAVNEAMFEAVFETCDADYIKKVFHEDNEFYHDLAGPARNVERFWLEDIEKGECAKQLIKREPIAGTHAVYPMHYFGAIVHGENRYLRKTENGSYELEDTGKYMHLWHLKDGQWKLFRAISYDHQPPEGATQSE